MEVLLSLKLLCGQTKDGKEGDLFFICFLIQIKREKNAKNLRSEIIIMKLIFSNDMET